VRHSDGYTCSISKNLSDGCKMRSLKEDEQAVLAALTDDFISTSVVKIRSGFSSGAKNDSTLAACLELERRGLAECKSCGSSQIRRWRLVVRQVDFP
jgi:hypothetical protein